MALPAAIRISEVGPRDGLQNEPGALTIEQKVAFIDHLSASGVAEIEAGSFVSPKWVPQMAGAEDILTLIERPPGVVFSALVPNERGLGRALALGPKHRPDKVALFTAASDTFSQRNTNASIAQSIERFRPVIIQAKAAGLAIRAYISCIVACPYEGPVAPAQVRSVAQQLLEAGLDPASDDIDLGETLGMAAPSDIEAVYEALDGLLGAEQTTLHLHDTRGTALACAYRAMQLGVVRFDGSCAGLGGCPFAPGAAGNLATEDLVYICRRMGCETGVDLERLFEAGRHIRAVLQRPLPGRVFSVDGSRASGARC